MRNVLVLFIVATMALGACRKDKNNVIERFRVNMHESLDTGTGRSFYFLCATEKVFECTNYMLAANAQRNGNEITLSLTGILKPTACDPGAMHASSYVPVGVLENGNYKLTVRNGSKEATGTLTVTDEKYTLAYTGGNDVTFTRDYLNRIPPYTIWGTIMYQGSHLAADAQQFLDSLVYLGAKPFVGPAGHYNYFETGSDNNIIPSPYVPEGYTTREFIYKYQADNKYLDTLAKHYNRYHPDTFGIIINTWNGKYFINTRP